MNHPDRFDRLAERLAFRISTFQDNKSILADELRYLVDEEVKDLKRLLNMCLSTLDQANGENRVEQDVMRMIAAKVRAELEEPPCPTT